MSTQKKSPVNYCPGWFLVQSRQTYPYAWWLLVRILCPHVKFASCTPQVTFAPHLYPYCDICTPRLHRAKCTGGLKYTTSDLQQCRFKTFKVNLLLMLLPDLQSVYMYFFSALFCISVIHNSALSPNVIWAIIQFICQYLFNICY